jgi:hypothetical protein
MWRLPCSPERVLSRKSLDEYCDHKIKILDGEDKQTSTYGGGPPYQLGSRAYEMAFRDYGELRRALIDRRPLRPRGSQSPSSGSLFPGAKPELDRLRIPKELSIRPWVALLDASIKAVPAVKWALGVAGVISVVAIVAGSGLDMRIAAFGATTMLTLMSALVVFARLSRLAPASLRLPALVLVWFSIIVLIAVSGALFTSIFFDVPVRLRHLVGPTG